MVDIMPFKGIRYDENKVGDLSLVVAPPYDVITKEEQEELYNKSPYNIVRLDMCRDRGNKYNVASRTFRRWLKEGILIRDDVYSIYLYEQTYLLEGGEKRRKGFICSLRLEGYSLGNVLPHEKTLSQPKEDRLKLMEACSAQLSPVFGLYSDPHKEIERIFEETVKIDPLLDITDKGGVRNRLWQLSNGERLKIVIDLMKDKFVLIADGHHRYETALAYRDIMRGELLDFMGKEPFNYVMMYLSNMDDEGFTILPTHRLIHSIPPSKVRAFLVDAADFFIIEEFRFNEALEPEVRRAFYQRIEESGKGASSFGVFIKGIDSYFVFTIKSFEVIDRLVGEKLPQEIRRLDLTILHSIVINLILGIGKEDEARQRFIDYVKDRDQALELVKSGRHELAFILNSPDINNVIAIAKKGGRMPQKSTYFYPKLLTGLVIYEMGDGIKD